MNSIVTGGCGFIGSHLVEKLLENNHKVFIIDNFYSGSEKNIANILDNKNLVVINGDINNINKMMLPNNIDYIFHLAGLADIVPSIENPMDYFKANVAGTLEVLEFSKKQKNLKKLVYTASSSCYGIPETYPTNEEENIDTKYPYALTKFLGEQLVLHWNQLYKIPCNSLRLFNVYGIRSRTSGAYGAVFGVFLAQKANNKPLTIVGDGTQTRDFTYVSDVVEALYLAALSNISGEIFNVGSGKHVSVNYISELIGGEKVFIPKRPGEPDCTFADISKIQNLLKWKPFIDIDHGVKIMLENIDYWKKAPVWNKDKINKATKIWFKFLKN